MGSVLGNLITWTIVILAVTMALSELGVDVGVFAAGLGLLGAGVGFGAQSLVRDLISGLFIVFEDQYGVGDMVDLGQASGVVESVGLRVTQVRDAEGILWYVRNGEVIRVGNHSQGWSRVVLDVAVPFDVDIDKVESAMLSAAKTVAKDPTLSAGLIGEPEVWGIQMLSGDEVVIRLVQKLKPAVQDSTARALRLEVKKAFDGAKIAMASSQTPVHVSLLNPASKK
jgi:small conductance mechanosensitive channel